MFTAQVINRVNGSSQTTGSQRTEPRPEEAGLGREGRSRAWRQNRGFDHTLMCSCSDSAVVVEGKPGKISNVPVSMTIRQAARRHLTPHLAVWWRIPALRAFLLIAKEPNTTCNRGWGRERGGRVDLSIPTMEIGCFSGTWHRRSSELDAGIPQWERGSAGIGAQPV